MIESNPFAVLSLIAAPAVLTNATSVLIDFRIGVVATAVLGLGTGCIAITSIAYGLVMLLGDTRLAVTRQCERAELHLAHTKRLGV